MYHPGQKLGVGDTTPWKDSAPEDIGGRALSHGCYWEFSIVSCLKFKYLDNHGFCLGTYFKV